ncbi:MAG TPA: family 78 glycoside hydrolase catalytic domain [Prolixibacteraceae bacterium]|nr:family 78 glycoside hydrolase catalytic domain [Prolixibacteraceae bacterium]
MKIFNHTKMAKILFICIVATIVISGFSQKNSKNKLIPTMLTTGYQSDPNVIQSEKPAFSWNFETKKRDQHQTAYQVLVASSLYELRKDNGDLWNSDRVESDRSFRIHYEGKPLQSRQVCHWKVRTWDAGGMVSDWSEPSRFEIALTSKSDWNAKWIGQQKTIHSAPSYSPLLRKEIEVAGKVKSARVYFSGLGWSELYLNGKKVSGDVLSPGLTDYNQELFYCAYDVTSLLMQGPNAIGIMLGNGWYSATGIFEKLNGWATRPQAILQMEVAYEDGTEKQFITDETWKTESGPIVSNEKRPGEEYDARLEKPGWNTVGYNDEKWSPATVSPAPLGRLICQSIPPMKVQDTLRPVKVTRDVKGGWLFEFDRFFSGWVRLNVKGKAGTKITISYERDRVVTYHGERDTYILKGDPDGETYEPRFTFHPVRRVSVEGLEGEPSIGTLEGREVYSDVDLYGSFSCSNELLNRIHGNVQGSLKVGLKGFILDCLHREPITYNEPASLFGSLSTRKFMPELWLREAREIQLGSSGNGDLSDVVPVLPGMKRESDVSQNAAYPMLIWYLYECYGDRQLLAQHYPTAKAWIGFIGRDLADSAHIVRKGWLGEHMLPRSDIIGWDFISKETPKDFIWTCLYYQNVRVLAKMSRVLGKTEEESRLLALSESIRETINREWLNTGTGHYATASQTSDILPLAIGVVPPERRQQVIDNIAGTISDNGGRLKVGHIGLPGLMESLVENGLGEVVYKAVNTTEYPGWGYMVSKGATTVWEGWSLTNGTYQAEESMTMLTGVSRFLYESIAGIQEPNFYGSREFEPGYGLIRIKPYVPGDLTYASASIKTVRGILLSNWKKTDNSFVLDVNIPVNTSARVSVPLMGSQNATITESGKIIWKHGTYLKGVEGIKGGKQEAGYVTFDTGSGEYQFKAQYIEDK